MPLLTGGKKKEMKESEERLDGEGEQKGQVQAEASFSKEESDEETLERGDVRATRRGLQGTTLAGGAE